MLLLFLIVILIAGGRLVLATEIVEVGFCFREFHLVHAYTGIVVEEAFSSETFGEKFSCDPHLLANMVAVDEAHGLLLLYGLVQAQVDVVRNPLFQSDVPVF